MADIEARFEVSQWDSFSMGERGPVPKPSSQRRRRNAPERPIKAVPKAKSGGGGGAKRPPVDGKWHPIAKRWYVSLGESGQSVFYEPSDWATAQLIAEAMSRELAEQPLIDGSGKPVMDSKGKPVMLRRPIKGAALAALLAGAAKLLATEGDRRRLQIELRDPDASGAEEVGSVSSLDAWRSRTDGTG